MRHVPVLLSQFLSVFKGRKLRVFIDGTLGAGGHAAALLEQHPELELFIGIDRDPEACRLACERLDCWKNKVSIHHGSYGDMDKILQLHNLSCVDGIFLDLGVSSMQLDQPEKGFSFLREGPLDMRMDVTETLTAEEVVNEWSEKDLGRVFRDYGEEKRWRRAAAAIVRERSQKRIVSTLQLAQILEGSLPQHKHKKIHPATLVFQGLRICVNRELEILADTLPKALNLLCPKGQFAVISFHSLEDRLVKNAFRYAASDKEQTSGIGGLFVDKKPQVKLITRKPLIADDVEIAKNPRSRSAKMRVVEYIDYTHRE